MEHRSTLKQHHWPAQLTTSTIPGQRRIDHSRIEKYIFNHVSSPHRSCSAERSFQLNQTCLRLVDDEGAKSNQAEIALSISIHFLCWWLKTNGIICLLDQYFDPIQSNVEAWVNGMRWINVPTLKTNMWEPAKRSSTWNRQVSYSWIERIKKTLSKIKSETYNLPVLLSLS